MRNPPWTACCGQGRPPAPFEQTIDNWGPSPIIRHSGRQLKIGVHPNFSPESHKIAQDRAIYLFDCALQIRLLAKWSYRIAPAAWPGAFLSRAIRATGIRVVRREQRASLMHHQQIVSSYERPPI